MTAILKLLKRELPALVTIVLGASVLTAVGIGLIEGAVYLAERKVRRDEQELVALLKRLDAYYDTEYHENYQAYKKSQDESV